MDGIRKKMNNIAPSNHHECGPSQWPAFGECSDFEGERDLEDLDVESLMELADRPKIVDKTTKGRGQACHGALAKALRGLPDAFEGLSESEATQVRWTAEEMISFAASVGYSPDEFIIEERVTMFRGDSFEVLYFGTTDVRFGPFVLDAKFGDERNYVPQLAGYCLPIMEDQGYTSMYAACFYGRLKRVRHYKLTRETVETIAYAILRRRLPENRRPTLCSYCGWCAKKATCSAVTGVVDTVLAKRADWAINLPTMRVSQAGVDPVTVGAMKWIWKAFLEDWGKGVDFTASTMAAGGIVPLGFKLQPEKGRLEVDDGPAALTALKAAGVGQEHLLACLSHSQTSLVKAYQAQFDCSEKTAKEKVEEILVAAGCARRGEASFKLIRKKDAEDEIRAACAKPALAAGQEPNGVANLNR
jgi:hypothetical protein